MFGMFDNLSDRNDIYKVETVKDCFVGVSGAPEKVTFFRTSNLIMFHKNIKI